MSFEIATGISATAGGLDLDVQHDLGARRLGAGVVRIRVVHEQIADLRFDAADLVGLYHQVAERDSWIGATITMPVPNVSSA